MNTFVSYKKPPPACETVVEGIFYAFDEDQNVPLELVEAGSTKKKKVWWKFGQKSLLKSTLLPRVKAMKPDNIKAIPPNKIGALKNLIATNPLMEKAAL